eukprot:scaffold58783_cov22-Prasinocladus_malaysianus.AAC.1
MKKTPLLTQILKGGQFSLRLFVNRPCCQNPRRCEAETLLRQRAFHSIFETLRFSLRYKFKAVYIDPTARGRSVHKTGQGWDINSDAWRAIKASAFHSQRRIYKASSEVNYSAGSSVLRVHICTPARDNVRASGD